MKFEQGKFDTPAAEGVNSAIMEQASETAASLTELQCEIGKTPCWISDGAGGKRFSEEAQEIHNNHYDRQMVELYGLVNNVCELTAPTKEEKRIEDAAHYLYESDGLTIGEQIKALEAQAKIDDMVGAESVQGVCVWEPFEEYAVKSLLKMF